MSHVKLIVGGTIEDDAADLLDAWHRTAQGEHRDRARLASKWEGLSKVLTGDVRLCACARPPSHRSALARLSAGNTAGSPVLAARYSGVMRLKELTVASAVSADVVSAPIAEAVDRVALSHERIILTRDGKPVAAMVPLADVAALEAIEDAADADAAAAALAEWEASGRPLGATLDALAERHGIDLRARDA